MLQQMPPANPEEWGEEYRHRLPLYTDYTAETHRLLCALLDGESVDVAQVEPRTKEVPSFVDKVRRKQYAEPLTEMKDLSGVRVILYFPSDLETVGDLIEEEFDVDWDHSERQRGTSDPDRFGYRSDHYVVTVSADRLRLAEWSRYANLTAEIQVRTVMQHAWAAVDHKLRYKPDVSDVPPTLLRRLSRLSALLEVADEQFETIGQEGRALQEEYTQDLQAGNLNIELDSLSIQSFLAATSYLKDFYRLGVEVGYSDMPVDFSEEEWAIEYLRVAPEINDVLHAADIAELGSLAELDRVLQAAQQDWLEWFLRFVLEYCQARDVWPSAVPEHLIAWTVLFAASAQPEDISDLRYKTEIEDAIHEAIEAARDAPRDGD